MMNARYQPLVAALIAVALGATAGCDQPAPGETAGRNVDRAADQVAANTGAAAARTAQAVDDTAITAKVKAAMFADPELKALQIHVDTVNATVTLAGDVDNPAMHDRAVQVASGVEGVRRVVDNLVIKSTS